MNIKNFVSALVLISNQQWKFVLTNRLDYEIVVIDIKHLSRFCIHFLTKLWNSFM